MEDTAKMLESLLEKANDYGKTSFELIKLKSLDKSSEIVSSLVPHSLVFILFSSFMLFFNLGLALCLGELLGKIFYGFFVVATFYVITGIVIHFFMHNWLRRIAGNYFIKSVLK